MIIFGHTLPYPSTSTLGWMALAAVGMMAVGLVRQLIRGLVARREARGESTSLSDLGQLESWALDDEAGEAGKAFRGTLLLAAYAAMGTWAFRELDREAADIVFPALTVLFILFQILWDMTKSDAELGFERTAEGVMSGAPSFWTRHRKRLLELLGELTLLSWLAFTFLDWDAGGWAFAGLMIVTLVINGLAFLTSPREEADPIESGYQPDRNTGLGQTLLIGAAVIAIVSLILFFTT